MNFLASPDQRAMADSIRDMLVAIAEEDHADFSVTSTRLAGLGLPALLVAEEAGGLELGLVVASSAARASGEQGVAFPVAESIVAAPWAIRAFPLAASSILSGDEVAVTGQGSFASQSGALVPYASQARWLVCEDQEGVSVLDLNGPGVTLSEVQGFDVAHSLYRVWAASPARTVRLPARGRGESAILSCAEMIGAAEAGFGSAVEYVKQRVQFGKAIGSNQALKQLAAENFLRIENMRVAIDYAAAAVDACTLRSAGGSKAAGAEAEARTSLAVVKTYAPRAARKVIEDSMQMFGGVAMTWELGLHLRLRRIIRLAAGTQCDPGERARLVHELLAPERAHGGLVPYAGSE